MGIKLIAKLLHVHGFKTIIAIGGVTTTTNASGELSIEILLTQSTGHGKKWFYFRVKERRRQQTMSTQVMPTVIIQQQKPNPKCIASVFPSSNSIPQNLMMGSPVDAV